jgi:hypothetical protein
VQKDDKGNVVFDGVAALRDALEGARADIDGMVAGTRIVPVR